MNHKALLDRLKDIEPSASSLIWFNSYFSDHLQSVRVNSLLSDPLPLSNGVPQGSILVPTLFNIYDNKMPLAVCTSLTHIC